MINMNKHMENLLSRENRAEELSMVQTITDEIADRTKLIRDCVIFDQEGDLDEKQIDISRVLQFFKDWTGYEVSCNELRFTYRELPVSQILYMVDRLDSKLSQRYEGRKFGIILVANDEWSDLRFHTYRENEGLWLDGDLSNYNDPILYKV